MNELQHKLDGRVERPHWAAQIEDVKNATVSRVLNSLGWQPRIQTYASIGSTSKVRILGRVLYARPGSAPDHHDQPVHDMRSLTKRGFRNFTSQNDPHSTVEIILPAVDGPQSVTVRADRSGLIDAVIDTRIAPGLHQVVVRTDPNNAVKAELYVVADDQKYGVVSDVDDTVMVTLLPRPLIAAWNAFVINQGSRRIVPGMPVLYQQLRRAKGGEQLPFIYLSTGAWNVSPFLQRFLFKNGYPRGPLLLTDWGPTNTGFFRSGQQHKNRSLEQLHEMFPDIAWILVGDDGQHDPEIYSEFTKDHPEAVHAVAIRELTDDQQDLAHGASRPIRSVGAAFRALIGVIPRVWKRAAGSDQGTANSKADGVVGADRRGGDQASVKHPASSPSAKAQPSPAAAATGVTWVSGADGFALIKALRSRDIMPTPRGIREESAGSVHS